MFKKGDKVRWVASGYDINGTVISDQTIHDVDIRVLLEKHNNDCSVRLPLAHYVSTKNLKSLKGKLNFIVFNAKNTPEIT